jgi:hypothetical protein
MITSGFATIIIALIASIRIPQRGNATMRAVDDAGMQW